MYMWRKKKGTGAKKSRAKKAPAKTGSAVLLRRWSLIAIGAGLLGVLLFGRITEYPLLSLALPMVEFAAPAPTPQPPLKVDVDPGVSEQVRIEVIEHPEAAPQMELAGTEPKILIYHTHNTEAYTQTPAHSYEESGDWRTYDNEHNIVAVGELLAKTLREEYGFSVLHDTTDHEPPKLSTAYSRSVETMERYRQEYPSLTMFIDVHRDAGGKNTAVTIDGKQVARLMFVVGTGEGATGTGFGEMPDFESNYALATAISNAVSREHPTLMRNIRVKTGRYNQHISDHCLLVEVGDNMNTLEEALNAVPHLAKAIAQCAGMEQAEETMASLWVP